MKRKNNERVYIKNALEKFSAYCTDRLRTEEIMPEYNGFDIDWR